MYHYGAPSQIEVIISIVNKKSQMQQQRLTANKYNSPWPKL